MIKNLTFNYEEQKIFDNFMLDIGEESPTVILGPSGSGKTTILKMLAGLLKPDAGEIVFSLDGEEHSVVPRSFMFQEPRLLPWLNIFENVVLPVKTRIPKKEAKERAMHFLEIVSMARKAKLPITYLSGGERQRVSMARAFTFNAPLLLLDEPFQSLDIPLRITLMDILLKLLDESKRTCVVVTHDPREALYIGRRIIVINRSALCSSEIVFDELCDERAGRSYADPGNYEMERRLIAALEEPSAGA